MEHLIQQYNDLIVNENYIFSEKQDKICCRECLFVSMYKNNLVCTVFGDRIFNIETTGCYFINQINNKHSSFIRNYAEIQN